MPVKIEKVGPGKFKVSTPNGVKAKNTTLKNAKAQERLLNAVDHNPAFVPNVTKKSQAKKHGWDTQATA